MDTVTKLQLKQKPLRVYVAKFFDTKMMSKLSLYDELESYKK